MSDRKYWLLSIKVKKTIYLAGGRISEGIVTWPRFIQAQTEIEAVAKFKLTLKANEKYDENQTIQ